MPPELGPMARKTSLQRQRDMNLRGRSISATKKNKNEERSEEETDIVESSNSFAALTRPDTDEASKTKNIHDIVSIPEMVVETDEETDEEEDTEEEIEESDEEEEIVNDSLEQGRANTEHYEEPEKEESKNTEEAKQEEQQPENNEGEKKTEQDELLQIEIEDVEEEVEYWKQAVVCFILGANPPWDIIEGFIRRIWTKFNIDKISFMPNGIFLVRFKTMEMKEKVLLSGHYLFDNKPMIVKAWDKDMEMNKDHVKSVPAWIKIHNLPVKFWGKGLPKITKLVGKYVKCDMATEERMRLGYARVMVELQVDQHLPNAISFRDENGGVLQVKIEYEWKPIKCTKCQGMGHDLENCRKGEMKKSRPQLVQKKWKPVLNTAKEPEKPATQGNQATQATTQREGKAVVGLHTPLKRLVKMNNYEKAKEGYSNEKFGAFSYKEVAASPPKLAEKENETGLFGLLETKIKNKAYHKAACSFSDWCITSNSGYHPGGRIWVIWKPSSFRVHVIEYNAQFIHMKIDSLIDRRSFWLTMVYAFNGIIDRGPLWNNLRKHLNLVAGPWAIAGDFNCVMNTSERVGGNSPAGEMEPFRRCAADCGLVDIAAVGALYTWNNKQKPEDRIYSRIDRFLVNQDWCDTFSDIYAHFMPEGLMDHTPCLLKSTNHIQGKRSFKYFNMWGDSVNFLPLVRMHWDAGYTGTPMFRLAKNLKNMKAILKELNKDCFSDIENAANILQKQVEELQEKINKDPTNVQNITKEYEDSIKLQDLSKARESFLTQKSKLQWIKDGDTNSAYFHGMMKRRRNKNKIALVEDMNGKVCDTPEQIQKAFIEYYHNLLGSSKETKKIHKRIISLGPVCTADQWNCLRKPVSGEEIKDALFSIPDIKSPGPDGYTSKFFKDSWGEIGKDVISAVQDFFQNRQLLKQFNATNITLIPKSDRPKSVLHFRPIACCNVVYKIISKLLCSRLAEVLPQIVNQNQGAFIHQRSIQENILICQDLIRLYERPHASARCMFKIDLQKAYDTVEWCFIENILDELHFPPEFKAMLLQCITTTTFSFSMNGEMFGYFQGKRGLRQGDPLSPLIFTLCMEYLTRTLQYATSKYEFKFHPMCKEQRLTSLMFADDVMLFSKGDATSMMLLLRSFATFSSATGLQVSTTKSTAFFRNVPEQLKRDILQVSGYSEGSIPFTYLGMPIQTTRLKKHDCECLVDKICARINGYGARKFSYAGRLVIVKSVLNTLHSYWASLFVIPKGITKRIEAVCRNFLWDNSADYRRAPLVAWDSVCRPKDEGGLGLKDLETWNKAMVGRLVDWVAMKRDSIWVHWVQSNYLKGRDWMEYKPSSNSSWVWRKICQVKDDMRNGYTSGLWTAQSGGFTNAGCYEWLRGTRPKNLWWKAVWNVWMLPKHQFLGWLVANEALNTTARLARIGMDIEDKCSLCGVGSENLEHLFCECSYSRRIVQELNKKTGWSFPVRKTMDWCVHRTGSPLQRGVQTAMMMSLLYQVWQQRNKGRNEDVLLRPEVVAGAIMDDMRSRVRTRERTSITLTDRDWLRRLNLIT
ncbi:uncharacterized protein LOC141649561 [Silene latifolia]|uniref:uncharacterized protein LOC141649561 n=1 Tax=Silene latifolia TaxID=37657 RepID=UPI003D77424F